MVVVLVFLWRMVVVLVVVAHVSRYRDDELRPIARDGVHMFTCSHVHDCTTSSVMKYIPETPSRNCRE